MPQLPYSPAYSHKTISKIRRSAFIGKLASGHPSLVQFLNNLGHRLLWPGIEAIHYRNGIESARLANTVPQDEDQIGYRGDQEVIAFLKYREQIVSGQPSPSSESKFLYENQIRTLADLLGPSRNIRTMLNFGVCYAYVDSELARRFPDVEFVGVDRSPFTKTLNRVEFGPIPNLNFFADDIFDHLKDNDYSDGLFFHSRTGLLLNRPMLMDVYDNVYSAKFQLVVGFEQIGLSRKTFSPFTFTLEGSDSVLFRDRMYIHNYPALLRNAGFRIEEFEVHTPDLSHPDLVIASFVARRDPKLRAS